MKKRRHSLQFQWRVSHLSSLTYDARMLIEQLRYMQLLSVVTENNDEDDAVNYVLKVNAPVHLDDVVWVKQNVERMKSFGINAVQVFE